ncbi:MAG: methyltransferase domain-containing protein [Candidatus Buchananbacteria bacterium]
MKDLNTQYWKTVPAKSIIGRNAFPGDELIRRLEPGSAILDLGCGTGEMAQYLSDQGYRVTGIDINEEAISQNKLKPTQVDYVISDITDILPFADESFDAIIISFVLVNIMPLSKRKALVLELNRILKPGALIWVNEGLVSEDYNKRYELSRPFVDEKHNFFVFNEGTSSSSIETQKQMEEAIEKNKIARIAHHFETKELETLFKDFEIIHKEELETRSPNTKSVIRMAIMVFQKK